MKKYPVTFGDYGCCVPECFVRCVLSGRTCVNNMKITYHGGMPKISEKLVASGQVQSSSAAQRKKKK